MFVLLHIPEIAPPLETPTQLLSGPVLAVAVTGTTAAGLSLRWFCSAMLSLLLCRGRVLERATPAFVVAHRCTATMYATTS